MSWKFEHHSDGSVLYLTTGQEFIVGRRGCDFVIENNSGISRKHASITVSFPDENIKNPNMIPIVKLVDLKSKYGTYHNDLNTPIPIGGVILKHGDEVLFGPVANVGSTPSKFRVVYTPVIVTTSCLELVVKKALIQNLRKIGGHCVSEWKTICTHVVMNEVKVTIKAACALVLSKPLVTPNFFAEYLSQIGKKEPLPDLKNYIPPSGETSILEDDISFHVNNARATIFKGKTFLFLLADQHKKMDSLLTMGGAKTTLIDKLSFKKHKQLMLQENVCVVKNSVQITSTEIQDPFDEIGEFLKEHNKRLIPESDIGMAVVYCSTETYTNPSFHPGDSVPSSVKVHSQSLTENESVYAPDSNRSEVLCNTGRRLISGRSISTIPETAFTNESANGPATSASVKMEPPPPRAKPKPSTSKRQREGDVETTIPREKLPRFDVSTIVAETLENDVSDFPVNVKVEPPSLEISGVVPDSMPETVHLDSATKSDDDDKEATQPLSPSAFDTQFDFDEEEIPSKRAKYETEETVASKMDVDESVNSSKVSKKASKVIDAPVAPKKSTASKTVPTVPKIVPVIAGFLVKQGNDGSPNTDDVDEFGEKILINRLGSKFASLVVRKPKATRVNVTITALASSVKNFKKFKKVAHAGTNRVPRIIGADQLKPYTPNTAKPVEEFMNGNEEMGDWLDDVKDVPQEVHIPEVHRSKNDSEDWI